MRFRIGNRTLLLAFLLLAGCGQALQPGASIREISLGMSLAGLSFTTPDDDDVTFSEPYPGLTEEDLTQAKSDGVISGFEEVENAFGKATRVHDPKDSPFSSIDFSVDSDGDGGEFMLSIFCHLPSPEVSQPVEEVLAGHRIELEEPEFVLDSGDIGYAYRFEGKELAEYSAHRFAIIGPDARGLPCLKGFAWRRWIHDRPERGRLWEDLIAEAQNARRWFQEEVLVEFGGIFAQDLTGATPEELRRPGLIAQPLPMLVEAFESAEGQVRRALAVRTINAFLRRRGKYFDLEEWRKTLIDEAMRRSGAAKKAGQPATAFGWRLTAAGLTETPDARDKAMAQGVPLLKDLLARSAIRVVMPPVPGRKKATGGKGLSAAPIDKLLTLSDTPPRWTVSVSLDDPEIVANATTRTFHRTRRVRHETDEWLRWRGERDRLRQAVAWAADRFQATDGYVIKGGYGYKIFGYMSDGRPIVSKKFEWHEDQIDWAAKEKYDAAKNDWAEAKAELETFYENNPEPPMFRYEVFDWTVEEQTWEAGGTQDLEIRVNGEGKISHTVGWTCTMPPLHRVTGNLPEDIERRDEWIDEKTMLLRARHGLYDQARDFAVEQAGKIRAAETKSAVDACEEPEEARWLAWLFGQDASPEGLPTAALSDQGAWGGNPAERQRRVAEHLGIPVRKTLALGSYGATMDMVLVPPGSFVVGEGENASAGNRVWITRPFYMSATEVTVTQYRMATPSKTDPPMPVTGIEWKDAMAFAERVGEMHDAVCRLPTEAEWEHACRAGSRTDFANGDTPEAIRRIGWMRFEGEPEGELQSVGQCEPNAWGLYDMHGNARELCLDGDSASLSGGADPYWKQHDFHLPEYVIRGGDFSSPPSMCRASDRAFGLGGKYYRSLGFRIVMLVDLPEDGEEK